VVVVEVGEDRRRDETPVRQAVVVRAAAAGEERRVRLSSALQVLEGAVHLHVGHLRSEVGVLERRVPDGHRLRGGDQPIEEVVCDVLWMKRRDPAS
jgi:hypothetical protein